MSDIQVYSEGLFCLSLCAPKDMSREEIERLTNERNIAGTTNGWKISEDTQFKAGQPMPCPCERNPERMHWLLNC